MKTIALLAATIFFSTTGFAALPEYYVPPTGLIYTDASDIYDLMTAGYDGLEHKHCVEETMFGDHDWALLAVAGIRIKSLEFIVSKDVRDGRPFAYVSAYVHFSNGYKRSTFGCNLK